MRFGLPFSRLGTLGTLQLGVIAAAAAALIATLVVLHHQTEDYFTPITSYLSSVKVAFPPAALFLGSYAIAFLTGTALSDVPKATLSFLRNTFFQSPLLMGATIPACAAMVGWACWLELAVTPPAYEKTVALLLGGGSDNLVIVREKVEEIRKVDPVLAARIGKVVEVFAERSAINAGAKGLSGERARTFVRALEADDDAQWVHHPLRLHALAEAYVLFGQSINNAGALVAGPRPRDPRAPFRRAVELYAWVASSTSPLAPNILKTWS